MPIVCINRPNRTKARTFTESDAARIFCEAARDNNATWEGLRRRVQAKKCYKGGKLESECEDLYSILEGIAEFLAGLLIAMAIPESIIIRALVRLAPWLARIPGAGKLAGYLAKLPTYSREIELWLERAREVLRLPAP